MPQIKDRSIPGDQTRDPSSIELLTYNEPSGARKSLTVGPHLCPIGDGAGGYTTDASTKKILPKAGANLAIFNKSTTTAYSVTVGDSTVTAQAIGAVQAGTQFVGIACAPDTYTYVSTYPENWVVTNNNNLVVYLIDDPTYIVAQPANNSSSQIIQQGASDIPDDPNS
jgi:hypothetical protein